MAIVLIVAALAIAGHIAIGWFIWSRVKKAEREKQEQQAREGQEE